jgi:hypothetical protein
VGVAQTAEVNKRVPGVFYDDPDYKCRLVIRTQPPEVRADANPVVDNGVQDELLDNRA